MDHEIADPQPLQNPATVPEGDEPADAEGDQLLDRVTRGLSPGRRFHGQESNAPSGIERKLAVASFRRAEKTREQRVPVCGVDDDGVLCRLESTIQPS